jgi:peptide chain release factor 2
VAQKLMRERQKLDSSLSAVTKVTNELTDARELIEMAEAENDAAMVTDGENAIFTLAKRAEQMRLESMLSGEADGNDSYIEIHAGAGGTESQDWASMLLRMYTRWAERHDYKLQLIEESEGEAAGIKSTTLMVKGPNAYGWLKTEAGVHRLVRISPFDSAARRHTSFSSVTVYPVIDQSINIDIPEKDVRIDVYRASGAGGQHVNKTESAVRITHLPTGIAVACQTERSQHQNKANCWDMLKSKLYEIELEKKKAETGAFVGEKADIGWGHQIRSYVLQPYQLVKDLRTGVESRTPSDVLDGDLDPFMAAALAQEVGGKPKEKIEDIE